MNGKNLIIFACCLAVSVALPFEFDNELLREKRQSPNFNFQPPPLNPNDKRFEVTRLEGSGSRGSGFDVNAAGRVKLWESQNKLNQIHGSGSYSQHLGGPWGNSRPNIGGGISFTRRF